MFKVALISTDENPSAMGIKTISSNLIKHGLETSVIIMSSWEDNFNNFHWEDLERICEGSGLIGISCMTHGVKKAFQVRKALQKNLKIPVIVGGIHASLDPDSLMNDFDFVCLGEGEDLMLALSECLQNHRSFFDIPGLWGKYEGKVFKNPPQPLKKDINDYPFPDYDLKHHYIFEFDRLVPMELSHVNVDYFEVMGSRGCPHGCTYCSNQKIKENFPWRKGVRQYTIDYLMAHLKEVLKAYPVVRSFWFEDDTFFAKDIAQILLFADRYKKEIKKPFNILISPWTYAQEKVRILMDAGMNRLIFGIQSGSEKTNNNIYARPIGNDRLEEIVRSLNALKGLVPYYDFIGMNPFEAQDDLIRTIQFIKKLPTPFFIFSNNLAFYPGTKIRQRAIEAGLNISTRDAHTDARHGYAILKNEDIKHKLFHLIILMMGGKANAFKIGLIPRFLVSDPALRFYCFLDERLGFLTNRIIAFFSVIMMIADWKAFLKKHLNRKQIQKLKKTYHFFLKG